MTCDVGAVNADTGGLTTELNGMLVCGGNPCVSIADEGTIAWIVCGIALCS